MRPRKHDRNLPACMYHRHGAYYLVKRGKWTRLGADYAQALQEYALLTSPKGGGMADLIDRVLHHITPTLAANTVSQYTIAAKRLKGILLEFAPAQVRPMHIAAIKKELSNTPAMANRMISFLRVVFQCAVEWQEVESNPCIGIKRHKEQARGRYMTDDEFAAIRAAAAHRAIPVIMDLRFLTGQRIGDALSLRNDQITRDGIAFTQQKTGARLVVRMTPDLKAAIALARTAHPQKIGPAGTYETLLYTRGGKPYSYSTIKDAFDRAPGGGRGSGHHPARPSRQVPDRRQPRGEGRSSAWRPHRPAHDRAVYPAARNPRGRWAYRGRETVEYPPEYWTGF